MELGKIERKVLGAMLTMCDEEGKVKATYSDLANQMGYKKPGGVITFAIKILENENFITRQSKQTYRVLI